MTDEVRELIDAARDAAGWLRFWVETTPSRPELHPPTLGKVERLRAAAEAVEAAG